MSSDDCCNDCNDNYGGDWYDDCRNDYCCNDCNDDYGGDWYDDCRNDYCCDYGNDNYGNDHMKMISVIITRNMNCRNDNVWIVEMIIVLLLCIDK